MRYTGHIKCIEGGGGRNEKISTSLFAGAHQVKRWYGGHRALMRETSVLG
jgi:hypothetical protein